MDLGGTAQMREICRKPIPDLPTNDNSNSSFILQTNPRQYIDCSIVSHEAINVSGVPCVIHTYTQLFDTDYREFNVKHSLNVIIIFN